MNFFRYVPFAVIIGLLAAYGLLRSGLYGSSEPELPVRERVSGFELVNQDEQPVALSDSDGKIRLIGFFYVRCGRPGQCPSTISKLVEVQDMLGELNGEVVFLLVTFDPENDTPRVLRRYAELYEVDLSNWHFLTGKAEEVHDVSDAYNITRKEGKGSQIRHSSLLYVVDRQGRRRRTEAGTFWTPERIMENVKFLVEAD